jgi:hypothetical protein
MARGSLYEACRPRENRMKQRCNSPSVVLFGYGSLHEACRLRADGCNKDGMRAMGQAAISCTGRKPPGSCRGAPSDKDIEGSVAVYVCSGQRVIAQGSELKSMKCIVLFCCSAVVATFCRAATRVCLHDVFLMLVRVEGAHRGEGGAPGQRTWHT